METPNNLAGKLTEKIMIGIDEFVSDDYNKIYSKVYKVLLEIDPPLPDYLKNKPIEEARYSKTTDFKDGSMYQQGIKIK